MIPCRYILPIESLIIFRSNTSHSSEFINKAPDGSNNLCGRQVARFRKEMKISQRELADRLQVAGLDIDKNAIQRIECGRRFVTDIELTQIARILGISYDILLHGAVDAKTRTSLQKRLRDKPDVTQSVSRRKTDPQL